MWIDYMLKVPDEEDWIAVVRVTPDGETELLSYLSHAPADIGRELDAVQQRWTERWTWPKDSVVQAGAQIREYDKYPND